MLIAVPLSSAPFNDADPGAAGSGQNIVRVKSALANRAELIGINNRDLATLTIDGSTTRLLSESIQSTGRTIVSESGMHSAGDIREMEPYCDAFLIGSSIMIYDRLEKRIEEFICA